jgi:hypothetical protein
MAISEASITSAAGETGFVRCPYGVAYIGATGTISAGALLLVVKPAGSNVEYVADTINQTIIQENANEAGTGYGFFEQITVPRDANIALVADASFAGAVTACVIGEEVLY